tara:strand:+ start:1527 stop:2963 length:1437 start_codon:yes stop_codon:yes gene_type:complete
MGRLLTTFKDKTFEPSMKSYYQLLTDDIVTAPQIYDSLLYVKGSNAGSLAKNQENDDDVSTVEEYDTYMPVRFHNIKTKTNEATPASPTHTFFSVYNRAELNSPINNNMYEMWGDYNTSIINNDGYTTNLLGGGYNEARDNGTADSITIPSIYGSYSKATVQPTGDNRTVTYAIGGIDTLAINKDNVTVVNAYGTYSEVQATNGTFTNIFVHALDLDFGANATIANAYFIRAHDTTLPTVSGEKYFIKSNVPWETLLSGALTNTGAVTFNSTLAVTGNATFNANVDLQDDDYLYLGTGDDLSLVHNGTNSVIENDLGHLNIINNAVDKSIMFSANEADGAEAYLGLLASFPGVFIYKDLLMATDGLKLRMGASQDLEIYHDGSDSFIDDSGTGDLRIRSNFLKIEKYTGETMATFNDDNAVSLYFNNSKKLETTNTGVSVTGGLTTTSTVILSNLPTSDPSVAGQLWNSSGDLKISAG